jgi:hypothetical protein
MTNIVNRRTSTARVAIVGLASVLIVSTSVISAHIALAQSNSGIVAGSSAAGGNEIHRHLRHIENFTDSFLYEFFQ